MERYVIFAVYKAANGKYYNTGPGDKCYVRMSLENGKDKGVGTLCCFKYNKCIKCYLHSDPSVEIKLSWKRNPNAKGRLQRSEAMIEYYGYIKEP